MSLRPLENLKEKAATLAKLIVNESNEHELISELKKELGLIAEKSRITVNDETYTDNVGKGKHEERVGIWKAVVKNNGKYFIRDERFKNEYGAWANRHEIPPKSGKRRILYLGESAARGFLLHPYYTPARVLETILDSSLAHQAENKRAEVIDLARNDITIETLTGIIDESVLLEPDIMVIFAGNNWLNCFSYTEELKKKIIDEMSGERRFEGIKKHLEDNYRTVVNRFMDHVAELSRVHQFQVVYVVPEFNHLDFHPNSIQVINSWARGETGQWQELREQSETAIEHGQIDEAEESIRRMIELNGGNPLGYRLMAQCKLIRRLYDDANRYYRQALDTAMYRVQDVPCCISPIRNALLEKATEHGFASVDLPEVFRRRQEGFPAGRRFFLDYCHLTDKGIRIAMAHTAQILMARFMGCTLPVEQLVSKAPEPDAEVKARAYFFAAVHNAHRGEQPYELLRYQCDTALAESNEVNEMMQHYIQMATMRTVWSLNKSTEKMLESGKLGQYPHLLQPDNHYLMDIELVNAMTGAMDKNGSRIKQQVEELRIKEHGINHPVDLLDSYNHLISYVAAYRPHDSYYRAVDTQSTFFLVADKKKLQDGIKLKITYRVPKKNPSLQSNQENVLIKINGKIVHRLTNQIKWKTVIMEIDREYLENGVNDITLQWPPNVDFRDYDRETRGKIYSQNDGRDSIKKMMYPEYGQIFMFSAEKNS